MSIGPDRILCGDPKFHLFQPSTAPNGKRPQGIPRPTQPRPFNPNVGLATSSKGIGTIVGNYVGKTPGPGVLEHDFRDASNVGGPNPDFLPVSTFSGGWEKTGLAGIMASHKQQLETEKNFGIQGHLSAMRR
eukprot:g9333.t1